jgi:propionaldehyde dehydrogenase
MESNKQMEQMIRSMVMEILSGSTSTSTTTPSTGAVAGEPGVFTSVDAAIQAAKVAQAKFEECSLATRTKVIEAIRLAMRPLVGELAQRTYDETGMGRVADKIIKLNLALDKTPGVEDLVTECETGDNGMTLYELSPYGVIGAVTPSTNPSETLICNAIGMLAAGNAIYFSVHPGAKMISRWLVSQLNQIVTQAIGIENLIVTIAEPSIEAAQEMMIHKDIALLVVTGGPGVVHQALCSGKKTIGAGAGNPPAFVDETANIRKAAQDIVLGASFDNNILCIAEKSVVAIRSIEPELVKEMVDAGCVLIEDQATIDKLLSMTLQENGTPSRKYIGKNAGFILDAAGVSYTGDPRLIIMRTDKHHPFATKEMLMPILPVITVDSFEDGLATCLFLEDGLHHTATMHSLNMERLNKMARAMKTSIFVKNGPSYAGLGFNGEGTTTFTIATPTGEATTSARHFARRRRCCLTTGFNIR